MINFDLEFPFFFISFSKSEINFEMFNQNLNMTTKIMQIKKTSDNNMIYYYFFGSPQILLELMKKKSKNNHQKDNQNGGGRKLIKRKNDEKDEKNKPLKKRKLVPMTAVPRQKKKFQIVKNSCLKRRNSEMTKFNKSNKQLKIVQNIAFEQCVDQIEEFKYLQQMKTQCFYSQEQKFVLLKVFSKYKYPNNNLLGKINKLLFEEESTILSMKNFIPTVIQLKKWFQRKRQNLVIGNMQTIMHLSIWKQKMF
jgi:hypothetical protein